jgi:hypothetical protein
LKFRFKYENINLLIAFNQLIFLETFIYINGLFNS